MLDTKSQHNQNLTKEETLDVRETTFELTYINLCKSNKISKKEFIQVAFGNNIPNMLKSLAVFHFKTDAPKGTEQQWNVIKKALNKLDESGTYQ